MTLVEYSLRMEAYRLQEVKRQEGIALQAFLNQAVKATKGKNHPKPVYRKFEQFFNTQQKIDDVRSEFEPDYQMNNQVDVQQNGKPVKQVNRQTQKRREVSSIFAKRVEEFRKLKAQGKIIPLNQRRKEEK